MHFSETSFSVHNITVHMTQFVLMPVPGTAITWLRGHWWVLYSKAISQELPNVLARSVPSSCAFPHYPWSQLFLQQALDPRIGGETWKAFDRIGF